MDNLQLKRYSIIEKIGEGGMADVYLAYDEVLKRDCAIKILRSQLAKDPIARLRFTREADAASTLQHPNIVQIYDVGDANGRPFIVMEYVYGETLKSLIFKRGALEKKEAVFLMMQISDAIKAAHSAKIIHRDIKPQNILVKADGTAKITDFGIASVQGAIQLTQHDSVMGSVHYLAPECARGQQAGPQSDIYSLGVVFYEMLTGDVPFKGDNAMQVAMKHLQEEMPSLRAINFSIEQSIENIVIKATAKNPAVRYQNADEMLFDLQQCLTLEHKNDEKLILQEVETSGQQTRIFSNTTPTNEPKETSPKEETTFNWSYLIAGAVGVLVVLALLFVLFIQPQNSGLITLMDVENMSLEQAIKVLEAQGLEVATDYEREIHPTITKDRVIRSMPGKNEPVFKGDTIRLVLSDGVYFVVGNYRNMSVSEVRQELRKVPKISLKVEYDHDETVEEGKVIAQENLMPGDTIDPKRSYEIKLIVARPVSFQMPDVLNMDIKKAQKMLEAKGAKVIIKEKDPTSLSNAEFAKIEMGKVIATNPEKNQNYTQTDGAVIELEYYRQIDRQAIDKNKLETLLAEVNTFRNSPTVIIGFSDQFALDNTRNAAQAVFDNDQASQQQVDAVYQQLAELFQKIKQNSFYGD